MKSFFIKKITLSIFILPLFFSGTHASAQITQPGDVVAEVEKEGWTLVPSECLGEDAGKYNPDGTPVCGFPEVMQLISNIMALFMVLALAIATLLFVYAGFIYATSFGNMEKVRSAKKIFTRVAIGLAIVFGAFVIVRVIVSTIGVRDEFNQHVQF